MARALVVLLAAGLLLPGAAEAKGPHAILRTDGAPVEPGQPWRVRIELTEHGAALRPVLVAGRGERRVEAPTYVVRREGARTIYRATLVFPAGGEWQVRLSGGGAAFRFLPVEVGGGRIFRADTAFAAPTGRPAPLPPERFTVAADEEDERSSPILPLAGLALAGVGVITVIRRLVWLRSPRRIRQRNQEGSNAQVASGVGSVRQRRRSARSGRDGRRSARW